MYTVYVHINVYSIYICLPYFAGTELDNQKARIEFIIENTKTE